MLDTNDLDLLIKTFDFWDKLSNIQKEILINNSREIKYKKGQSIFNGENECVGVLIVKSGNIRTYITSDEGREVTLYFLNKGDVCILSASCVLSTISFDVSVEALEDSTVIQISSPVFSRISEENVYAELFSYKLASEKFSEVMWAMQQILFISFDKRLAAFLLDEVTKTDNLTINMTHDQIARYLGSAREVVSRMLKYFSNEGIVSLSRGGITVLDKIKLKSILG